ncbi:MAG TPA: class I SAM-dependent methyltransferase [Chitinophagaceae bacterium]
MPCPFCSNIQTRPVSYPGNIFNQKKFQYARCSNCQLVYLSSFPDANDYETMYPPSYQRNEAETSVQQDPYVKLYGLRVSYGYQFDLIKKSIGPKARILDYGCGTGHFIGNAVHYGFSCDGAEFNLEYLTVLRTGFPKSKFFIISQVLSGNFPERYDVIRLSNVLEHLTEPKEIISQLKGLLTPGGILLVEGPIEDNFSLAESFRKLYFRIGKWVKPGRTVSAPPYHIFFSNAKNQRQFFKDCGLEEIHFKTSEEAWPFSGSFREAKGLQGKITAIVAKVSKGFTKLAGRDWGNIFIYCGRAKG